MGGHFLHTILYLFVLYEAYSNHYLILIFRATKYDVSMINHQRLGVDVKFIFSVSTHAVGDLCLEGDHPAALVLESPFNNIKDEIKFHPLSSAS